MIFFIPTLSAQKLKNENIKLYYAQLPLEPLGYKTLAVEVTYYGVRPSRAITKEQAGAYLEIPGYDRNTGQADILVKATIGTYAVKEKELVRIEDPLLPNQSEARVRYTYAIHQKLPLKPEVIDTQGAELLEEYVNNSDVFKPHRLQYAAFTLADLQQYWDNNHRGQLAEMERELLQANLAAASNLLESQYGYAKRSKWLEVYTVKDKNKNYNDLDKAQALALKAYSSYYEDKATSLETLYEAIVRWEAAMAEIDTENKKARINKKIATAISLNLAVAYTWMDQFANARETIKKVREISKYVSWASSWQGIIDEQEARFNANHKTPISAR